MVGAFEAPEDSPQKSFQPVDMLKCKQISYWKEAPAKSKHRQMEEDKLQDLENQIKLSVQFTDEMFSRINKVNQE